MRMIRCTLHVDMVYEDKDYRCPPIRCGDLQGLLIGMMLLLIEGMERFMRFKSEISQMESLYLLCNCW